MNKNSPKIFVIGNEKGGAGKTTCSMHLIAGLIDFNYKVGSIDIDSRQSSLTSYVNNRISYNKKNSVNLPCSKHFCLDQTSNNYELLANLISDEFSDYEYVVIDTPGNNTDLSKTAHSIADVVITPVNDSFLDIDVLAKIDSNNLQIISPSIYSQSIWEQKIAKAQRDGKSIDWFVMRNRLTNLDALNKRNVADVMSRLSKRLGFNLISGFSERVIFRELFLQGLTLLDLNNANKNFNISHIAARLELRNFLDSLGIKKS